MGKGTGSLMVAVRLPAPVPLLTRGATIRTKRRTTQGSPARQQGDHISRILTIVVRLLRILAQAPNGSGSRCSGCRARRGGHH
jgi:hypothetical protein